MKKFFASAAALLVLAACNKKEDTTITDESATSEVQEDHVITEETASPFRKVEVTPEQATEMLSNKDNDTLYVTNFFATWCGPCVKELPHFREKMQELEGQPVKFTFVSLDDKKEWDQTVKNFTEKHGIGANTVLLDGAALTPQFFPANFKKWDGNSIPFTFIRKGDRTDETVGMMSKEMLSDKISSMQGPAL